MNIIYFVPVFLLFTVYFLKAQKRKRVLKCLKKRKAEDMTEMMELAKRFLGKECVIDTIEHQVIGIVKEVCDGALLLETESGEQALNLDFVERIREYPKNKNGKKKSLILD